MFLLLRYIIILKNREREEGREWNISEIRKKNLKFIRSNEKCIKYLENISGYYDKSCFNGLYTRFSIQPFNLTH